MPPNEPSQEALPIETPAPQKGALRPLSVNGSGEPEKIVKPTGELDDIVDTYLAENPGDAPPAEPPAPSSEPPASAEPQPPTEAPAEPAAEPKPAVEAHKPGEPPAAEPPQPAEAPKPAAPTYAGEEKFALGAAPDGTPVEWTRAQLTEALRERVELKTKAAEADEYHNVFGMTAADAKAQWQPVLLRLAQDQPLTSFIENVFQDTDANRLAYLAQCADHYDAEREAGRVQPQRREAPKPQDELANVPPAVRQELEASRRFREAAEQREATNRLNNEIAEATRKYPFLASDRGLMHDLMLSANALYEHDKQSGLPEEKRRGLPEAVAAKASIYDAILVARSAPAAPPVPEPAPVLGTPGPSPRGAARAPDTRPKKYDDLSDAVEDHLRENPA